MSAAKKKTKPIARQPKPAPYQTENLSEEIEFYSRECLRFIAEASIAFGQVANQPGPPTEGVVFRGFTAIKMAYAYGEILRDALVNDDVQRTVRIQASVDQLKRAATRAAEQPRATP